MTTLCEHGTDKAQFMVSVDHDGLDRREHRRHDVEQQSISIERWDGQRRTALPFGQIVDLSAGGIRIRTAQTALRPDNQIRVRLELPVYAGISPFVDTSAPSLQPSRHWVGWMTVSRVEPLNDSEVEVAGRLVDMDEMDRGMLGLYLSTLPMAA